VESHPVEQGKIAECLNNLHRTFYDVWCVRINFPSRKISSHFLWYFLVKKGHIFNCNKITPSSKLYKSVDV
ncbi:MAG: hypothetical protein N2Z58_09495, partial [Fervidobacterium sp.]|nr:hypothetical protein [Fervidobacterium sp.]